MRRDDEPRRVGRPSRKATRSSSTSPADRPLRWDSPRSIYWLRYRFRPNRTSGTFYDLQTPGRSARYHREIWYQNVTSSYEVARDAFEASGRRLFNATDGGRLDVLPRVTLDQVSASPPLNVAVSGGVPLIPARSGSCLKLFNNLLS